MIVVLLDSFTPPLAPLDPVSAKLVPSVELLPRAQQTAIWPRPVLTDLTTCVLLVPLVLLARTPPRHALLPPTQFALFVQEEPHVQPASSKRPLAKLVASTPKIVFARLANWPLLALPPSTPLPAPLPPTSFVMIAPPVWQDNTNLLSAVLVAILQ